MNEKNPAQLFHEEVANQLQYLKKYHEEVVRPLGHYTFPSITIINFLEKQLLPKLKERNKNNLGIISDIMNWQMPQFILLINKIDCFIVHEEIKQSKINASKVKQGFKSEEEMLRVPQHFFKEKVLDIANNAIKWNNGMKTERSSKESKALSMFAELYKKFLKQYDNETTKEEELIRRQIILNSYPQVKKTKVAIIFCKKFVFIARLKMRAKKAEKRLNKRKMKILQLIDGEKNYLKKIEVYTEHVKKPIQKLNILSEEDKIIIFSTIQAILQFHKQFHAQLQKKYETYHKYQLFGDTIRKYLSFFQIYQQYILYAPEATKKFKELEQQNEDVEEICKKCMQQHKIRANMALEEPTFKIARYQALFENIIKETNPIHPDYDKLVKAGQQFTINLKKINNKVDEIVRRNRLNQLQQQFGTQQNPIFAQKREFMSEFTLFLIKQEKLQPVIVFIFSDFLMVIDENTRKKLKRINIDETFYARRQEDNKTYRNMIKVHSDGFTTFSAGNQEKNMKKAQQFYVLLQKITRINQQSARLIYVQVIGTEEIGSTSFAKHTEYIVEIKFLGLRKYLYLRFSQMSPLVKKMQNFYKTDFGITSEEDLRKNWFNNHKSKIIEDRKRTIEQILGKIFNSEYVKKKPQHLLEQLGIQSNFLQILESPQNRRQTFFNSNIVSSISAINIQSKMRKSKKEHKQPETVLCATEIKLGRQLYHDPDEVILQKKKSSTDRVEIYVSTVVNEEPIKVLITQYNTVEDVCIKVSKLIGLRMNKDFRLFHEIGKKELRVLEHEQKMMKLFSFPKHQVKINGLFGEITNSFKKIFSPDTHPTLVFKKYYFLPIDIEQSETKKDLTRLRLLVYQIFAEIKDMKYQLSFDQYLLFLAMMVYIQNDGKIPEQLNDSYVPRIIPETIFKLKNYSEEEWIMKAHPHLSRLNDEIEKIIQFNRQQLKHKKIKADSVSKTALYFGHRHLCSQIVINKIKSNPIYGSNLFYVQPYKATYDKLVDNGCKMAYNMWLAIKVQSLNLLTPSSKETVLELKYSNIEKVFVYSQAIIFKMDGLVTEEYRLNTYQSFQISQLVKYNKALNETLKELERDQDLIEKARLYKQELLIYRNTYDEKKQ